MIKTSDLNRSDSELMQQAIIACKNAYAPYSNFKVGAAVLLESGKIVHGHNIENAAYPLCLCAERTALAICSTLHNKDRPISIAINAIKHEKLTSNMVSPCGACRQVLSEMESRYKTKIRIIFPLNQKEYCISESTDDLIPYNFSGKNL